MDSGLLVESAITVQIIIGVLCCLFGLKFQKVVVALIGCIAGFCIGGYLVGLFGITGGLDLVLKFGLAFVLGACSFGLFEVLISLVVGFCIFSITGDMFNGVWYGFLIGIVLGIIGGLLVKKYYKFGIILFTSFIGTHLIANNIISYFNFSYVLIFILIFAVSVIIQMSTNKIKL